ncbi:MAG: hypothetical protein EBS48_06050 [Actinobacteria bacterium]|nr:hypothetical protein [Actinomycetota bacterium]
MDAWSGPFSAATEAAAKTAANAAIPSAIRFQSMEVRLIVAGVSRKFWYRDGIADGDLVEFSPGGGGVTSPAGSTGQLQYNDGGVFAADSALTYDPANQSLSSTILSGSLTTLADGSPYLVAGSNVAIVKNPNGSLTISSTTSPGVGGGTTQMMCWNDSVAGDTDGINMVFELSNAPDPISSLMFYVNGVLQKQGYDEDYSLVGSTVGMTYSPGEGSSVTATYTYTVSSAAGASITWMETPIGATDGINQTFTLAHVPVPSTALMFHYNGVLQRPGLDYVLAGNVVTMNFVPEVNSKMIATYPY